MKSAKTAIVLCSILAIALTAYAESQREKIKPEQSINVHKIIRIHYSGAVIPQKLTVRPGSTVVWINESKRPVEIQFESKQVTLACKSPVHFILDEKGSFLSNRIPYGSVASLCFIEKGKYSFSVRKVLSPDDAWHQSRERAESFSGTIIVD